MKANRVLSVFCALGAVVICGVGLTGSSGEASTLPRYDFRAERLAQSYEQWKNGRHPDPGNYEVVVGLGWFKGVSAERSRARGMAMIEMSSGTVKVEVGGIDLESLGEVWLIDNRPGEGASAMPNPTDQMRLLGELRVEDGYGRLNVTLGPELFRDFDVDQVVVARRGEGPVKGGLLYGTLQLYERLYRMSWRIEQGLAPVAGDEGSRLGPLGGFPPVSVTTVGSVGALGVLGGLLEDGEDVFNNETFDGNGRTCATCHPPRNNLTLDKQFVSRLRPDDPLFVAESIDELNHELNGGLFFENPVLLREFALIVANTDGFDDLANNYVLRSPSHIFAQALSLTPANFDQLPVPPEHRLGWGGDGAPGSGTLREFAIGAVVQHAPLTLGRVDGVDFRLPTDEELDGMEAFQFSLGRQEELDLENMVLTDANVSAGQVLFLTQFGFEGGGRCQRCHGDGGAQRPVEASIDPATNGNFDIGIFNVDHAAKNFGEPFPFDAGFINDGPNPPQPSVNTFSTTSVIEAADTAPFFHDNAFDTLEGAVGHYSTDEFNFMSNAGIAMQRDGDPIDLTDEEINQVAALLRVLNALQNIEDVLNCDARVRASVGSAEARRLLRICIADNRDAIQVLSEGPLAPLHSVAQGHLGTSLSLHRQASQAPSVAERDALLDAAAVELAAARADMVDETP